MLTLAEKLTLGDQFKGERYDAIVGACQSHDRLVTALSHAVAALNTAPRFNVPSLNTTSYRIVSECESALEGVKKGN